MSRLAQMRLALLAATALATGLAHAEPPIPVAQVDLGRYMGRWYEIARFPNWFQKRCVYQSHADYNLLPDAQVQVINRCRQEDGSKTEAFGLARQIGDSSSPKLQVRFAPAWLSFIPAVWGDYWIIDLDEAYQLVAVSEPTREYLWVLARTPTIDKKAYEALLARLELQGFDLRRLEVARPD